MKRTLNNTATAKKIAADCGLVFSYVRGARIWRLTSKDFAAVRRVYDAKEVPNVEVDAFYLDCQYVASQTVTPEQMNTVVERARYSAMQERLNCGEEFAPGSADALEFMRLFNAAYTHDRHVWEVENAIHRLLEELEEQHGTYSDHKAAHAAQVEEVEAACDRFNVARACRVSLAKPEAPECACILADVPQESNAVVMARTLAVVRANRIAREYVAASAADSILSGVLAIAPPEVVTALAMAHEDARLAAEYLAVKDGEAMMIDIEDGGSGFWPFVVRDRDHDPIARFSYRVDAEMFKGEKERALAAEQARAASARKLAGGI